MQRIKKDFLIKKGRIIAKRIEDSTLINLVLEIPDITPFCSTYFQNNIFFFGL